MVARRVLTVVNGIFRELSDADQIQVSSISFASLPSLAANDVAIVYCPDYPSGSTLLVWEGARWIPASQSRTIDSYHIGGLSNNIWYAFGSVNGSNFSTLALIANTIYAVPFVLSSQGTIRDLAVNVTTAVGTSFIMFGIYENSPSEIYPGSLNARIASLIQSSSTVEVKSQSAENTLVTGRLYWAVIASSLNPAIRAISSAGCASLGSSAALGTTQNTYLRVARTFDNTLPAIFPAGAAWLSGNAPAIFYRWT